VTHWRIRLLVAGAVIGASTTILAVSLPDHRGVLVRIGALLLAGLLTLLGWDTLVRLAPPAPPSPIDRTRWWRRRAVPAPPVPSELASVTSDVRLAIGSAADAARRLAPRLEAVAQLRAVPPEVAAFLGRPRPDDPAEPGPTIEEIDAMLTALERTEPT